MLDLTMDAMQIVNSLIDSKGKRFSIITLGCKVNQAESQDLFSALKSAGNIYVDKLSSSDIVFVNTCAVTAEAEAKTRKIVRKAIRSGAPTVVVMGCASESIKKQMEEELKPVCSSVVFLDSKSKLKMIKLLAERTVEQPSLLRTTTLRTRPFVKIQDGCNQKCSYCVVPYLRGSELSVDLQEIYRKLEMFENSGAKEVVLTGIHLGRFEAIRDGKKFRLSDLLRDIASRFSFRIRLSSIDVFELEDELIEAISELSDRICPHFHIPLQSGSNRILKLMKRPYTVEHFLDRVEKLKEKIGLVALSTDVMVGFPGETEEDFKLTVEAVMKAEFMKLHVFRFSKRKGTDAFDMENQVNEYIKKQREKVLIEKSELLNNSFKKKLDGLILNALIERKKGDYFLGKTEYYVDAKISSPVKIGEMYKVKIKYVNGDLLGEVVE